MSLVRLLGFRTLTCGCVIGRYRDLASGRELTYVEEKGSTCESHAHRRNHTVWRALQQIPDERTANAETHDCELVDAQMIHQRQLVIGM